MSFLSRLPKWLFDLFFVVEDDKGSAELIRSAPQAPPEPERPQAAVRHGEAPAAAAKKAEAPHEEARRDEGVTEAAAKVPVPEDAGMAAALFDRIFAPVISLGDMQTETRPLTAQEKKAETAEYTKFAREIAGRSPKSAAASIKALADMCHKELASLSKDGERVRKHGLSKAVICKSKGRYRARYERISSYDMRRSDNLETLHIVDGEGRCYNNLGRAWASLNGISHKAEFLKKLLKDDYSFDVSNRELVKMLFEARDELEKERSEKHLKPGGK